MSEFIYQDLTPDRRLEMLAKNALRNEVANYARTLGEDELMAEKSAYAQLGINLEKLEAEKKEAMGKFAIQIKEIKALMSAGVSIIKNGKRDVEGKLFYFADQVESKLKAYDKNGELIWVRNLSPSEKMTQLYIGDNVDQVAQGAPNDHGTVDAEHVEVPVKETKKEAAARIKKEKAQAKQAELDKEPARDLSPLESKMEGMTAARKKKKKEIDQVQDVDVKNDVPESNEPLPGIPEVTEGDSYDQLTDDGVQGDDHGDGLPE